MFNDEMPLGQYDIKVKLAPIEDTENSDWLSVQGNDGGIIHAGASSDGLSGGNGEDTYIFAKGYGNDTINEWGSDHSIVILTDINSDEITVSDQWGSNLLISVNDTEDVLTISNFKWGRQLSPSSLQTVQRVM